jgi:O-antigen/teichoic acid export membrane protein
MSVNAFHVIARRLRKFGWLPLSQGIVFIVSTASFAVFARVLGPEPYARFAYILLIFTAVSLLTDLSPQGYILVRGAFSNTIRTAHRLAVLSGGLGSVFLTGALLFGPVTLIPGGRLTAPEIALVLAAMLAQLGMQVSRASLVTAARYRAMAVADVGGTVIGIAAAFLSVSLGATGIALLVQLATAAICRASLVVVLAGSARKLVSEGPREEFVSALHYGFRVIPLNLAAYLGRSLDSGLLPILVSPGAAAGYARSYQVVVTPFVQLQLSLGPAILERFARERREATSTARTAQAQLWNIMLGLAGGFGVFVILASGLIEDVLFGPQWPMVQVTIAAMASCLPGIAIASFGSWMTQIDGGGGRTAAHFAGVLVTPIAVITAAGFGDFQLALIALVVFGGLVQPVALAIVHRGSVPASLIRTMMLIVAQWFVMTALFAWISNDLGFWATPV